ncbi:MAG: class I SAM-dependent methyltransferase [Chloroflexi bacterium]|nr:class I SAM-dependent methyltransferase [Chloroflexota bacterium]
MSNRLRRATPGFIRRAAGRRAPDWHRRAVGGMWEEMGQLQFEFMKEQGLLPEHDFLDVGCGSLRGGLHFINYLEPGHYCGIDIDKSLLRAGWKEVKKHHLSDKKPLLVHTDSFDFLALNRTFDFALAQSVFTHLPLNSVALCLITMAHALKPGGKFFATFFENTQGIYHTQPIPQPGVDRTRLSYFDRDPYHYNLATFEWICEGIDLKVEYIGDWDHPRNQKMLLFTRTP